MPPPPPPAELSTIEYIVSVLFVATIMLLSVVVPVAYFGLLNPFMRGLGVIRRQGYSIAQVLTFTTLAAIWMALARGNLWVMAMGLLAVAVVVSILAGLINRTEP